ncbi:MAG: sugar transferase [Deltaproteobacteria bacterium]|nr:sugar transferase [Deltaproteobacteria bacterium]
MKLFSRDSLNYRLNGPLPLDPETGLYTRNYFLLRLREERERSRRTGSPFSLLVLDLAGAVSALNGKARGSARAVESRLIKQLLRSAREIDIRGWLDARMVGLLMPNTQRSGALEVKAKICNQAGRNWPVAKGVDLGRFVQVYTFDGDCPDGGSDPREGKDKAGSGGSLNGSPVYTDIVSPDTPSSQGRLAKRILDVVGSLLGIILTSPLMLILALLIKLTSRGPVLFRQERIGFLGRRFVFLKFRSMYVDTDPEIHKRFVTGLISGHHQKLNQGTDEEPVYKISDDPRVTPLGRFLRKTSLDELPQLFNILKGEMSLVGPRPPIPYEVEKYSLWHSARIFEVKPGLTGLWQVSGRSRTSFDDMVRLDLRYASNWSLWLDIKIILKTFGAVLSAKGAY